MRAILTGVVATIEAIAVALASLLAVAALAFLVWWLAFDLASEPSEVFAGAGAAWLLAHFTPLTIDISAETMQLFGFAPGALSFTLSLAPLGLTLVTVGFAVRAGWRFGVRGGAGSAGVLGGALGFGAVAGVVHSAVALARPGWFATAATAGLVYGLCSGAAYVVRAAREEHGWWVALLGLIETGLAKLGVPRPAVFPHRAGQTLRLAAMLLAGYVGVAAVALAVALLTRFAGVVAASEALQLDLWGTILMFVLQLALLPVLVLWSGSWLTGAGFAVGTGSSASPFGQLLGPMPGLPVLAAIPEGWGSAAALAPLVIGLVGLAIGVALGEVARRQTLPRLTAQVAIAALLAGLAVALGNWMGSGSIGPGRLATVGPEVWVGAGIAAAALGTGCFLGALAARADIARRVAAAPAEVATRLGLGDESNDVAEAGTHGDSSGPGGTREPGLAPVLGGAQPTDPGAAFDGSEGAGVRLAPVSPLVPKRSGRGRGNAAAANEVGAIGWGADEQPTEPIDRDDYDAEAARWEEHAVLPNVPEAELFDQHGTAPGSATDAASSGAASGGPDLARIDPTERDARPGEPADPDQGLDPDVLAEAYSWENVDLDPAPAEEPARPGWRWPRRKG